MLTYLNLSLRSLRSSQLNRFPPHRGKGPPVCTNIQRGSWGTDGSQQKRWQSWSNQSNDNNFLVKQDKQLNWQPTQWWHQGWAVVKGEILNSGKRGMIFKLNRPSNNTAEVICWLAGIVCSSGRATLFVTHLQPRLRTNTSFFSAYTEWAARGTWGEFCWIGQKVNGL